MGTFETLQSLCKASQPLLSLSLFFFKVAQRRSTKSFKNKYYGEEPFHIPKVEICQIQPSISVILKP